MNVFLGSSFWFIVPLLHYEFSSIAAISFSFFVIASFSTRCTPGCLRRASLFELPPLLCQISPRHGICRFLCPSLKSWTSHNGVSWLPHIVGGLFTPPLSLHLRFRPALMLVSRLFSFDTRSFLSELFRRRYTDSAHAYCVVLKERGKDMIVITQLLPYSTFPQ